MTKTQDPSLPVSNTEIAGMPCMTKETVARTVVPTNTEFLANIAASTGLSDEQVAVVLEALAAEVKTALSNGRSVARIILGLAKSGRKVSACLDRPAAIRVTVVPELLPGPDQECARGLHTYHKSPASNEIGHPVCGLCGNDDIDWERLHERDIADVDYVVAQLRTDRFRDKRWCKDLDEKALRHASRKGSNGLRDAVRKRIETSVGPARPFRDGTQTPYKGNIIHYGQHATATCCRECIEVWHGIPHGHDLTREETDYLVDLLLAYTTFKLPELRTPGQNQPTACLDRPGEAEARRDGSIPCGTNPMARPARAGTAAPAQPVAAMPRCTSGGQQPSAR